MLISRPFSRSHAWRTFTHANTIRGEAEGLGEMRLQVLFSRAGFTSHGKPPQIFVAG